MALDIRNPLHRLVGEGRSRAEAGRELGRSGRKWTREWAEAEEQVFGSSPLWPFRLLGKPTTANEYEADPRLHRRRGWWHYRMDVLVQVGDTQEYEWRAWGVGYRHPVTWRKAVRDAILTFDAQVGGVAGTNLFARAAVPLEVRRFV